MDRDTVSQDILNITNNNILIELATGVGKSKSALDIMKNRKAINVLIVIPKLVLIENWKAEILKWKVSKKYKFSFSTYAGFHKFKNTQFDMIIYDEAHHLTERCLDIVDTIKSKYSVLLSATVGKYYYVLKEHFKDLYRYKVTAKEAIDNEILPDPTVYLIPLSLDSELKNYTYTLRNQSSGESVLCDYKDRWKYLKDKKYGKIVAKCTQRELIYEMNSQVEYWKNMAMRRTIFKNKWLRLAGERLKLLSDFKTSLIIGILQQFKNERVLTFCNSIEQTQLVCPNCINSSNEDSGDILNKFNNMKINHISTCQMLNEGVNLSSCRIGLYASLNASEIMIKQKLGRVLRHPNPVLIIPYYKDTRDEEIVLKMTQDYNPDLVYKINNINDIKL